MKNGGRQGAGCIAQCVRPLLGIPQPTPGPVSSPGYSTFKPASSKFAPWKIANAGSIICVPDTHMENMGRIPSSCFPLGQILALSGIWGVNQNMKGLHLCLPSILSFK